MRIDKVENEAGVMLSVSGDIDMETSPTMRDEIKKSLKRKPGTLRLRLSDVPYIDSSGVAVLIEGMRWSKKSGSQFHLVAISENVRAVLELSKLLSVFTIDSE